MNKAEFLCNIITIIMFNFQTFDGADIADLLINLLPVCREQGGRETKGFSVHSNPVKMPDQSAVEDLEMLLATGRVKDALEHSVQAGLWGHAFMLGSLMGHKYLGTVQTKYVVVVVDDMLFFSYAYYYHVFVTISL